MVINKIKNKVLKPIVYRLAKERQSAAEEAAMEPKELKEAELEHLREVVLKEIKELPEKVEAKEKPVKNLFKKPPVPAKTKPKAYLPKLAFKFSFKGTFGFFIKAIVLFLILSFIVISCGIYLAGWQGQIVKTLTSIIPYPAVYIEGQFVLLSEFFNEVWALENYLQRNGIKFSSEQVRSRIMRSLIERGIIQNFAQSHNIVLTDEEVQQELSRSSLQLTPPEDLDKLVNDLYGWDFSTYTEKVIKPLILAKRVENWFDQTSGNLALKQEMEGYYQQFLNSPQDFEEIASAVNQDQSKSAAGDLGWLKLTDFSLELQLVLLNLAEGELSPVATTDVGYYIIRLNQKVADVQDSQYYFHVSQIFKKKSSFQDFIDEEIKKAKVITLIKI